MQRGKLAHRPRSVMLAVATVSVAALALSGCTDAGGGDQVIRVVYPEQPPSTAKSDVIETVKAEFEEANEGWTLELVPINAADADYFSRIALMFGSPDTAPDIVYDDTFQVNAHAEAGYLAPLDEYLTDWEDWDAQYSPTTQDLGKGLDGTSYGIPITGGTIGLWYDKSLFEQAGLPTDWQPETWDEFVADLETLQAAHPDIVPFAAQTAEVHAEGSTFQTFQVLLQGTEGGLDSSFYDPSAGEFVTGSEGFNDALTLLADLRSKGLLADDADQLDPNYWGTFGGWFTEDRVGVALTGSWLMFLFGEYPEWTDELGWTPMPSRDGGDAASMSGGWVWAMGAGAADKEMTFEALTMLTSYESSLALALGTGDVPTRIDVAETPEIAENNPSIPFFYDLVNVAGIRPGVAEYPQVSAAIAAATEAVTIGGMSPEEAQAAYDEAVRSITGG
ncbi:extracellular solute-binding protein [Microcella pacifica]|uniref:Extracellular solute-binding protein n=1 Tax=Microcella pacifica TaxID=2591847 RepID=A0A9E5JMU0_9MICO|nr:extracellular solute-binding protein [Microcella pacifica]NHF62337.1 extracellular solute-binding protein [Microcella pacifica]